MASKEVKIDQWMKSKGEGGTIGTTEEKKLKKPIVQVKTCNGEQLKLADIKSACKFKC